MQLDGTLDILENHVANLPVERTIDVILPTLEGMPEGYQGGWARQCQSWESTNSKGAMNREYQSLDSP